MVKKQHLLSIVSAILAILILSFASCNSGTLPQDTTATTTTDSIPTTAENESTIDTMTETQSPAETEAYTEAETQFDPVINVPDTSSLDITHLLEGTSIKIDQQVSLANANLSSLKANSQLTFTNGSLFQTGDVGLTTTNTNWDSIGFAQKVTTENYTFTSQLYAYPNDRGGNFNAVMAGVRIKQSNHLFIDSGLWFSFRDNTVTAYIKGGFERVITTQLPFSAADGITFKVVEDGQQMQVFANDTLIATATIADNKITLCKADGQTLGTHPTDNIATENYGYMRAMSHYANAAIAYLSLTGETQTPYAPNENVLAFAPNLSYAFSDKSQYLANIPTAIYGGTYYADAQMLSKLFGWEMATTANSLTLKKDNATLTLLENQATIKIGDTDYAFPTLVKHGDSFALAVEPFATMQGYVIQAADDMLLVASQSSKLTKETRNMAQERFDLYRDVVYNYADVECGQTGVGKFEAVDPSERLVGMAYSTWHTSSRAWGTATWDTPLYGTYNSDNVDMIYRHGIMLRDAGVDFVFIDWSNNTGYVPETMRDKRPDFRMIEEATDVLFDTWKTIPNAPKICIFVGPGHNGPGTITSGAHQKKVDQVYRDYVTNPDRADMYFYYLDKPLLICYGATPTQYSATPSHMWDDDRFTVRWMTGYVGQQSSLFNAKTLASRSYWSWEERGEQTFAVHGGYVESVTVTAATRSQGKEGGNGYIPAAGRDNGATLKKQFQRACDLGSKFVIVVSWNEWTTGEQPSPEVSKDIEPSVIHGTFYYDLLREQIKKFKGLVDTNA